MGYEFRCLPGEQEILRRLLAPDSHRLDRRRAVERPIDFRGRKPRRIPGEPILFRHPSRIKRPAPAVIGPARCADKNLAHAASPWHPWQTEMLNNAAVPRWLYRGQVRRMSPRFPSLADFRRIVV